MAFYEEQIEGRVVDLGDDGGAEGSDEEADDESGPSLEGARTSSLRPRLSGSTSKSPAATRSKEKFMSSQ